METFEWTRWIFQRALGFIYFIAFLSLYKQYLPLLGENGLLPAKNYLKRFSKFRNVLSIFWFNSSDKCVTSFAYIGLFLSVIALTGYSEQFGLIPSMVIWLLLWGIYLSFVNIGQIWYGFGWETLLLETGFLAIFYGSVDIQSSEIHIWLYRWILFRVMLGAGLIKLRGDRCWWDLTCMYYHYETQPMPNPLSWYFHQLPKPIHRFSVLFTHFIELIVPFFFFAPAPYAAIAGGLTVIFQFTLILSGNLSWLNYLTIVLCIPCFNDTFFQGLFGLSTIPAAGNLPLPYAITLIALTLLIVALSIRPSINLFSRRQQMNASFDRLHLVNTYGAFGIVTKDRYEIVIQGNDSDPEDEKGWKEYEFVGKPGKVDKKPPIIAPYHLRLDWLMWFAAMDDPFYHSWFEKLLEKILQGDKEVMKLLENDPFNGNPPQYLRVLIYKYNFAQPGDPKGVWWRREFVRAASSTISLSSR